jgi:hypothetical protein
MAALLGRFRVSRPKPITTAPAPDQTSGTQFVFRAFEVETKVLPPIGSFEYDLELYDHEVNGPRYQERWESFTAFQGWLAQEQCTRGIEFRLVNTYKNTPVYERSLRYVCSRGATGGRKEHAKKHPEWSRKCEKKFTDCPCKLIIKEYPGTNTILGHYSKTHNHDVGNANLRFTQIPKETREYIAGMLRLEVAPDHIVRYIQVLSLSSKISQILS